MRKKPKHWLDVKLKPTAALNNMMVRFCKGESTLDLDRRGLLFVAELGGHAQLLKDARWIFQDKKPSAAQQRVEALAKEILQILTYLEIPMQRAPRAALD